MNKKIALSELALPIIIIIAAITTIILFLFDVQSPIRAIVSFAFLLLGPGYAYIRLISIKEFLAELIFSIALSLSIGILISELLVLMAIWSAGLALLIVATLSIFGALLQFHRLSQNEYS